MCEKGFFREGVWVFWVKNREKLEEQIWCVFCGIHGNSKRAATGVVSHECKWENIYAFDSSLDKLQFLLPNPKKENENTVFTNNDVLLDTLFTEGHSLGTLMGEWSDDECLCMHIFT